VDLGLWLLLHLRPPRDRRGDRRGTCEVCGAAARFVRNSWVISRELRDAYPPELVDRETLLCSSCGSSRRVRRLARVLLEHYADAAEFIAALVLEAPFRSLRIAEINAVGRMHPFLGAHPGLRYSEYPEEDLQALSYEDRSFDLVLTSDTLEHVPDPMRALREIRRVLRPGGRHIFTVPVHPRRETTRSREGLPPEHHGRGGGPFSLVTRKADLLAHTDFGVDLPDLLRRTGFEPETHVAGMDLVYCARVPAA
jgi:SAM-dependent methyltransferase